MFGGLPIIYLIDLLILCYRNPRLCWFFFSIFFSGWINSIDLSSSSLSLYFHSTLKSTQWILFQTFYFYILKFTFDSLLHFYCWDFLSFINHVFFFTLLYCFKALCLVISRPELSCGWHSLITFFLENGSYFFWLFVAFCCIPEIANVMWWELWVLVYSFRECWDYCFSLQLARLDSSYKLCHINSGLWLTS